LPSDWPVELLQNNDSALVTAKDGAPLFRGLRVRVGIHYGPAIEEPDPITGRSTYYGPVVNTAVQLEKISHGGQIVLTSEVWEVIKEETKPLHLTTTSLGLVDIDDSHVFFNLYQLEPKRLTERKFPPLRVTVSQSGPMGKVTLVFTDIQGSTPQWDADPETMEQALQLHNDVFRNTMREHHGYEVKTEGDAFMIAFADAAEALRFCIRIQYKLLEVHWPEKLYWNPESAIEIDETDAVSYKGLRVRMGLLTGEPICSEDPITGRTDYFGPVVNRAARVQSAANGGQIIMSGSTWAEVKDHVASLEEKGPPEVIQLGEFRLKGLDNKELLIEIKPNALRMRTFPAPFSKISPSPIKEASAKMTNLSKTNEKMSANITSLSTQLTTLVVQSQTLKQDLSGNSPTATSLSLFSSLLFHKHFFLLFFWILALETKYVSILSANGDEAAAQRAEFHGLATKLQQVLQSQQRLEQQITGATSESKEFQSIVSKLNEDSSSQVNRLAEQKMESVASKHRMEQEKSASRIKELTEEVKKLEVTEKDLQAKREVLENEVISKNVMYEATKAKESALVENKGKLEEMTRDLQAQIETFKRLGDTSHSQSQEEKDNIQQQLDAANAELSQLKGKIEQGVAERQESIARLQEDLERLGGDKFTLEKSLAAVEQDLAEAKVAFGISSGEKDEQRVRIQELEALRESLQKALDETSEAEKTQKAEIAGLKKHIETLEGQLKDHEKLVQDLEAAHKERDSLSIALQQAKDELESHTKVRETDASGSVALKVKVDDLHSQLLSTRHSLNKLEGDARGNQEEIEKLRAQTASLEAQLQKEKTQGAESLLEEEKSRGVLQANLEKLQRELVS